MLIRLLTFIVFIISTALPAVAETTWNAYVVNVEDGNTISVSTKHGSDEPEAVLIFYGIEAPSHNQPFGPEAVAYLKSVMYQLTDNGKTILVPKEMVYDERIKIAGEGGLVGQGIGFEIFDKVKVGQTDFVQKINYTRALQGELSRTISEFPGVESARVHLVIPHRSLFVEERQSPSASVVLKLKHPNVKPDQKEINAILNMGIRLPIPVWPSLRTSFFPCRKKKKSTRPSRIPAYLSAGAFCPAPATVSRSSPSCRPCGTV